MIPRAITDLLSGEKIKVYGQGENIRDWIHVRDHNKGVEAIIKNGQIGETYCLGGGGELKNIDLVKKILAIMNLGEDRIEFVPDRPGHDLRYAIDSTKAQKELGWKKEIDFETGLRETIEWYKNNENWWKKLK
jgi:dTDP-glucose 4,6-dehydratase